MTASREVNFLLIELSLEIRIVVVGIVRQWHLDPAHGQGVFLPEAHEPQARRIIFDFHPVENQFRSTTLE